MDCQPTNTPPREEIDIPALRAKYLQERDKRLTKKGQNQYEHLTSDQRRTSLDHMIRIALETAASSL